jgi:hypothetical protein
MLSLAPLHTARDRFQKTAAQFGKAAAAHDLAKLTASRIVFLRMLRCLELRLPDVAADLMQIPAGFSGRFVSKAELLQLAAKPEYDLERDWIERTMARGDRCYGLFEGDRLASYGWYSKQPTNLSEDLAFAFDPRDVYMYKGLTLDAYRGKRLHGIGMAKALEAYVAEGSRGIVSYVESHNFSSLKSCERLGYRSLGTIAITRAAGRYLVASTGTCEAHGITIVAAEPEPTAEAAKPRPKVAPPIPFSRLAAPLFG